MIILSTNEKMHIIKNLYERHKELIGDYVPVWANVDNDIFILATCMTNEYVWNWIENMKKCPPNSYPLDKYFNPNSNVWVDLYLINGNNKRIGGVNPAFVIPNKYIYIAQQWENEQNNNDFATKWREDVERQNKDIKHFLKQL